MAQIVLTPPEADHIEISVFGPGYGECIVIHLGGGDWLINDSCVDSTGRPVALSYLRKLGVDPGQVKLVVASHWHDDHVRGLSKVVAECTDARFICSGALGSEIFLQLVAAAERDPTSLRSGASEFRRIITMINARGGDSFRLAGADQLIWQNAVTKVRVHALSPSAASLTASYAEIAKLVDEVATNRIRIAAHSPNASSVVVWVDIADTRILLGGDLENHSDFRRGWESIIRSDTRPPGRAEVYKVAHHGSRTAHNEAIWSGLLDSEVASVITPWRRGGNHLPDPEILKNVIDLSARTSITAREIPTQMKRSRLVTEEVSKATRSMRRLEAGTGQVQLRKAIHGDCWTMCSTSDAETYNRPG
ncbi:ComEC/Rec2 family competence protein [Actinoplanes couchii]|uniref:Metallo-beta-lactamase domain-containing protein n=1 Tax=Actinoplanes couchii TaxID=403638 RepID=A0ABQ3X016_9ACTN|nr:MBL fold metallo-hydrolase [Actinoplanes couchii]MDR6316262.1 beta-lactamase superfamily II metal-dependent hydrolase [Actinoplanes couchii]GID51876.1 hypothetical protein Aco03nite_002800 [Actinoplanes couchii]